MKNIEAKQNYDQKNIGKIMAITRDIFLEKQIPLDPTRLNCYDVSRLALELGDSPLMQYP